MNELRETHSDDLRQYLTVPWARKWLILVTTLLAGVAAFLYFSQKPKQYTSSTAIFVQSSPVDAALFGGSGGGDPQRNTQNLADLISTRAVAAQAARTLHFRGDPIFLLGAVRVSAASGADIV